MIHEWYPFLWIKEFRGDLITMDEGDHFAAPHAPDKFLCAYIFTGSVVPEQHFWTEDLAFDATEEVTAGPGGRQWYCLSKVNPADQFEIGEVVSTSDNDPYTLLAGWGFVVVSGEADCDGVLVETFSDFFTPRETDLLISGLAQIILLR